MSSTPSSRLFAPVTKRIVLLANSSQRSGYQCVAGREIQWEGAALRSVGPWVRLVRERGSLTQADVRMEDGALPDLCDIIDVPLEYVHRLKHQPEDRVVAPEFRWGHAGRLSTAYLGMLEQNPATLWHARKRNPNFISIADVEKMEHPQTLLLIRPTDPELHVWSDAGSEPGAIQVHRRVRFTYHGTQYDLPIVDRAVLEKAPDALPIGGGDVVTSGVFARESLFAVNLAGPFGKIHHKVVVGVIPL